MHTPNTEAEMTVKASFKNQSDYLLLISTYSYPEVEDFWFAKL